MHILVLSRNANLYSTSRLVEAIEEAGHIATVLDHMDFEIVNKQDGPRLFYRGVKVEKVDAVIPRIGASVTYYGSAVVRQFEMMGVFTAITSQALITSRDKLHSLQRLSAAGVDIPKTAFTNFSEEVGRNIASVGGAPLIIKLLESTQGVGVMLAPNYQAAESIIQAFHSTKSRIIVQEFIEEAKGEDIRAFIVDGRVVGAMKRRGKAGEFRSNLHRGSTGEAIQLTQKEKNAAITAADEMELSVAGVDLLQSNRGPLVLEVNSSPGLQGIEKATKIDIAGKIVSFIEHKVDDTHSDRCKL